MSKVVDVVFNANCTTVGSKSGGKYAAVVLTAFGENLGNDSTDSRFPIFDYQFFTNASDITSRINRCSKSGCADVVVFACYVGQASMWCQMLADESGENIYVSECKVRFSNGANGKVAVEFIKYEFDSDNVLQGISVYGKMTPVEAKGKMSVFKPRKE